MLNNGDTSLSTPGDIAQCFADKFSKNFSTDINSEGNASAEYVGPRLELINVEVNAVRKLLMEQRNSAAGPDGIPGIFYKKLACVLAIPLSITFQQSVQHRKIPDTWRQANVMPLYKGKGPKSCASSYRPVCLTDVARKLLKRLISDQIRYFWVVNKLLCNEQYGFLPGRSTVTNLVTADSIIADCLNNRHSVDVILLDFAQAFNKVRHDILISKLSNLGISAQPLDWITDFLSNRTQTVICSDSVSAPISVTSGVLQGSVLRPLLFEGFSNDLPEQASHCDILLFADHSKAIGAAADSHKQDLVQQDLNSTGSWSEANHLTLSIDKCMHIHYGLHNKKRSYSINGTTIKNTDQCADLGVTRTSNFHSKVHVDTLCLKAAQLSGMVTRLFSTRSRKFLMKLFLMYIRTSLEYASIIWSPRKIGANMQLERVQSRFTRQLFG